MNNNAIILIGPTASSKSDLAIELAELLPIEIISVDSALIYQDMNIGTAKPSYSELSKVKHHLIDIISPLKSYSVASFVKDSSKISNEIINRGNIPVFVGGTMMYFNALINGISNLPESDTLIRQEIENELDNFGLEYLYQKLEQIDNVSANKIKPTDKQRIIRALEVYKISGVAMSKLQDQLRPILKHNLNFTIFKILPESRELLHNKINKRLLEMLNSGFIEEVVKLQNKYPDLSIEHTSMRSVGYKQIWQYLNNEFTYTELIEKAQAATRQLAKRQLTWLNNKSLDDGNVLAFKYTDNNLPKVMARYYEKLILKL